MTKFGEASRRRHLARAFGDHPKVSRTSAQLNCGMLAPPPPPNHTNNLAYTRCLRCPMVWARPLKAGSASDATHLAHMQIFRTCAAPTIVFHTPVHNHGANRQTKQKKTKGLRCLMSDRISRCREKFICEWGFRVKTLPRNKAKSEIRQDQKTPSQREKWSPRKNSREFRLISIFFLYKEWLERPCQTMIKTKKCLDC